MLQSNTCSWESQQLTSVNCWLWKWKDVSTFQIFFVFLGLRIFTRIYCIWSETREQNLNDLLSYNGPQFLIKNRFTNPNDLKQPLFLLFLICSLLFDLSSTGLIKKRGTQCFISSKRESYPWRTSQKFKPNPNEIFLRSKNILAWVRFKFLGNQAFLRGCGGR